MNNISIQLAPALEHIIQDTFNVTVTDFEFQATRKEFEGDLTLVVFGLLRAIKGNPVQIGEAIGNALVERLKWVKGFNVVKGFLNIEISDAFFVQELQEIRKKPNYGKTPLDDSSPTVLVEYSSPNTNKPLHLGHVRNNLLGFAVANILEASGKKIVKTQIINDRGIHVCKSMVAWQDYGNGETPESTGLKGDKLVGNYYVLFDKKYKEEVAVLISEGLSEDDAKANAPLFIKAQQMLRLWESGDLETVNLWGKMNSWVYDGFAKTYEMMGVSFDSFYYESETYLLGKELIEEGLSRSVFYKKEDGSVWVDLTDEGLDEKLLLRSDGTAVYMTQDLGTALQRYRDNPSMTGLVYTVGNEQDYHFQVLFLVLKKLGYDWAQSLFHLSYGMVDLPQGKMKSREGTVVDADDLMDEMKQTAKTISQDLGKLDGLSEEEKSSLYEKIGLGALKYFILKVDPKKRILFDPESSVDFAGNTGPFIQYTYARIQSILKKVNLEEIKIENDLILDSREKEIIKHLMLYPGVIQQAAKVYSPAIIANYSYDLVKMFNSFYQNISILGDAQDELKNFRVALSYEVARTLKDSFGLLGINVPNRM
ncbi:MAG: arginine--tRNA ligase [Flavobacteriales bacterium]|jgi:arginyl-tRNA synthetase|nr:arginine--tRNA ligase [Candidatus Arcticimaribacter sp.]|tara:strand:- start:810 stop:2591 length:1782 start_codon:yes stop_codon:yes gene_type:complete